MYSDHSLFESAFEHAAIGMALISLEGKWLKVNNSVCKMLGYNQEEFSELTFQKLTHPQDLEADLTLVRMLLSGEIETYQLEKRYFSKSGEIVWGFLSVSLIRDSQGGPSFFISQIQDITELKIAEQKLLKKETLEALWRMSVQVAHEINNPLTVIDLNIQRIQHLLKTTDDTNSIKEALLTLRGASERINNIVKTLSELKPEESEARIDPKLFQSILNKSRI